MQKEENLNQSNVMILFVKLQKLLSLEVFVGVLSFLCLILMMGKCATQSRASGGNTMYNEHSQTIRLIIKENQTLVLSCENGHLFTIVSPAKEESITVCQQEIK